MFHGMRVRWYRSARAGWAFLALGVLAWDLAARDDEMLTEGFRRARQHPASLAAVTVAWVLVTAHLYGLLPDWADPFRRARTAWDARRVHALAA
jgi:hypothetical protein